jgi:hypothetical protein
MVCRSSVVMEPAWLSDDRQNTEIGTVEWTLEKMDRIPRILPVVFLNGAQRLLEARRSESSLKSKSKNSVIWQLFL